MMIYTGVGATDKHARLIMDSYRKWTGRTLLNRPDSPEVGCGGDFERLFHVDIVVLSHGTEADPVLNFGNKAALSLWEMDWDAFTRTPSKRTAEPMERVERASFLRAVSERGYVDDYTGIRISSTGRKFYIMKATVWNLVADDGTVLGQAAAFREHRYV